MDSASQPKERNSKISQQKKSMDRHTKIAEQYSTVNEEAVKKAEAGEKRTVATVATKTKIKTSASLRNKETSEKVTGTTSIQTPEVRKDGEGSSGDKTEKATPTDQIKTGGKGKKGRKKKKNKALQNASKNDKKPQSPVMKRLTDFFPVRRSSRRCKSSIEVEEKKRLEESILSGKEDGMEVRQVVGKGRGVVATKDFRKGQFVVEYRGDLIDVSKAKGLEAEYGKDSSIGCYMYYFEFKNKRYCVDATKETDMVGRLLNHSKSGNCCTKLVSIQDKPHLILVAQKDIKEGEELLYDYGDRNKDVLESHPWLAL